MRPFISVALSSPVRGPLLGQPQDTNTEGIPTAPPPAQGPGGPRGHARDLVVLRPRMLVSSHFTLGGEGHLCSSACTRVLGPVQGLGQAALFKTRAGLNYSFIHPPPPTSDRASPGPGIPTLRPELVSAHRLSYRCFLSIGQGREWSCTQARWARTQELITSPPGLPPAPS